MGAEIALAAAARAAVPITRCVFDGGPFFRFPRPVRAVMARKFWSIARRCRGKDPQAVMQDALLRRLSGDDPEQFRALWGAVCEVSGYLTAEDCRAKAEICYDGALPAFSEEQQRRFTFLFSEGEPAHASKKRLLRAYPAASYIDRPGNSHCGFQVSDPEGCAAFLKTLIVCPDGHQGRRRVSRRRPFPLPPPARRPCRGAFPGGSRFSSPLPCRQPCP